jgi:hypothetical protein
VEGAFDLAVLSCQDGFVVKVHGLVQCRNAGVRGYLLSAVVG